MNREKLSNTLRKNMMAIILVLMIIVLSFVAPGFFSVNNWLSILRSMAIIGVAASVACLVIFGADSFLIPAMIAILLALTALRAVRKEAA